MSTSVKSGPPKGGHIGREARGGAHARIQTLTWRFSAFCCRLASRLDIDCSSRAICSSKLALSLRAMAATCKCLCIFALPCLEEPSVGLSGYKGTLAWIGFGVDGLVFKLRTHDQPPPGTQ